MDGFVYLIQKKKEFSSKVVQEHTWQKNRGEMYNTEKQTDRLQNSIRDKYYLHVWRFKGKSEREKSLMGFTDDHK